MKPTRVIEMAAADPTVRERFSQVVRGEGDSLGTPALPAEQLLNLLWGDTTPLPLIDRDALGLPAGATYRDGVGALVAVVWPAQAAELDAACEAALADALRRIGVIVVEASPGHHGAD